MFCRWCGEEIPNDSVFCSYCSKSQANILSETPGPAYVNNGQASVQPIQGNDDNTVMPLTIFCIILCFVGAISFFLPIVEAHGYNSSSGEFYTITYNGLALLLDYDFQVGGMYESFSVAARVCPLFCSLLYVYLMYQFYTCFNQRPGKTIPVFLIVIFLLGLFISSSITSTPTFVNSYLRENLFSGIGLNILAWDTIAIIIMGYVLNMKMEQSGFPS